MGEVKRVVSNLVQMLEASRKEAESLVGVMHELQSYLEEESKTIIQGSLDRLLSRIRAEAAKITRGLVVLLVAPEGMVTVDKTYSDENSDPYLRRLKSQDFHILKLPGFSHFIQSLKSQVAEGNLIPAIEFLRANAKSPSVYSPIPAIRESGQHASSEWKASDFLPALPPHPPLPRGLFKD